MKIKKLALLLSCSLFAVVCCTKQNGSLTIIDSSKNESPSSEVEPGFTDYTKLQYFSGHQELLKKSDETSGACFKSLSSLTIYGQELHNLNGEFNKIIESVSDEDFQNKKMIFTAQVMLTAGNISLSFDKMYIENDNLCVVLNLKEHGDAGSADIRYALYTFFVSSSLAYNKVNTIVYKAAGE